MISSFISDVLIVGAGQNGLALACGLAQEGFSVQVIDRYLIKLVSAENSLRVSALTPGSLKWLEKLGINFNDFSFFKSMEIWESEKNLSDRLHLEAKSSEIYLGAISHNDLLQRALYQKACELGVSFKIANPLEIERNSSSIKLITDQGVFESELLIGADGAQSFVRELSGIKTVFKNYKQKAIVAVIQTEKPHSQTAYQRFLPEGPLAFLPLKNSHQSSIVWSCSHKTAEKLMEEDLEMFEKKLASSFDLRLGRVSCLSERQSFDLKHHHAERYISEKIVLIGDAAHVIHPLAGLGLNLGFKDGMVLINYLVKARNQKRALGSWQMLSHYERERKPHNLKISLAMTGLNDLFKNAWPEVSWARQQGLQWVEKSAWWKRFFLNEIES